MGRQPVNEELAAELEAAVMDLFVHLLRHTEPSMSRTSASVLTMLAERPRRVTELAEAQAVAQPTMTVALQRLEARGLVTRERDEHDRRVTNVVITDDGRATLDRRRASRATALATCLDALDAPSRTALAAAVPALHALTRPEPA